MVGGRGLNSKHWPDYDKPESFPRLDCFQFTVYTITSKLTASAQDTTDSLATSLHDVYRNELKDFGDCGKLQSISGLPYLLQIETDDIFSSPWVAYLA